MPRKGGVPENLSRKGLGRPKGSKNRVSLGMREASRRLLGIEEGWDQLVAKWRNGTLEPAYFKTIAAYAEGLPVQAVAITGHDGGPVVVKHEHHN